ncbi:antibiotic ABC transporter ATP-binding protein [Clostridium sporogenes]|uniref:ABC transporter ATP-binding protein n=1 Tax=Clostridium sporogenes TaxID=1509 RepID=UPI0007800C1F|nr:ABC transporter ATP-binding protein [Clostridium sporogenes]KYN75723.1 antibiotic ABC transporter ATP-binding protein [Clostridium sporogenes]MBW5457490.1 ATP-binding cassette domain-containing protein [Clostridium sporogenes]NFM17744.1 ABC transporter ATP-binding protein [Clostridium sporogenes]
MNIIEIKNLEKKFGHNTAVNNINLTVKEGQVFGFLGPNGAGKSTTINMICGLLTPTKGEIFILGKKMDNKAKDLKNNIGIVPQDIAIYEDLTAYENVAFFGGLYGIRGQELKERVKETLEFVGLLDRAKDFPYKFSGGMKRRLNIACALVHQPKLIIMDEPTVGIDPQSRNHILESIKNLNAKGCTIIYTSHYIEEVEQLCTDIAIIDKGTIIAHGKKDALVEKYSELNIVVINTENSSEVSTEALQSIDGVVEVNIKDNIIEITNNNSNNLDDIIMYFLKNKIKIKNIENKHSDLETIFLKLTGKKLRD